MSTASDPWGRVDEDGTVFVRTAEGEREIGSWQAGSPDEALAFFQRKFAALETEVTLIEQRIATTDLSPAQAQSTIERLQVSVKDARAVGDLDGLQARLQVLSEQGVIDTIRDPSGESLYRQCDTTAHHHHLTCRECGRSVEVEGRVVEQWAEKVAAEAGFTSVNHTVELFGLCPDHSAR